MHGPAEVDGDAAAPAARRLRPRPSSRASATSRVASSWGSRQLNGDCGAAARCPPGGLEHRRLHVSSRAGADDERRGAERGPVSLVGAPGRRRGGSRRDGRRRPRRRRRRRPGVAIVARGLQIRNAGRAAGAASQDEVRELVCVDALSELRRGRCDEVMADGELPAAAMGGRAWAELVEDGEHGRPATGARGPARHRRVGPCGAHGVGGGNGRGPSPQGAGRVRAARLGRATCRAVRERLRRGSTARSCGIGLAAARPRRGLRDHLALGDDHSRGTVPRGARPHDPLPATG